MQGAHGFQSSLLLQTLPVVAICHATVALMALQLTCSQILCELDGLILRGPGLRALYGRSWQQLIRDDMGKIPFFTLQVSCLSHGIYLIVDLVGSQQPVWMTITAQFCSWCLSAGQYMLLSRVMSFCYAAICKVSPGPLVMCTNSMSMSDTASGASSAAGKKNPPGRLPPPPPPHTLSYP